MKTIPRQNSTQTIFHTYQINTEIGDSFKLSLFDTDNLVAVFQKTYTISLTLTKQ